MNAPDPAGVVAAAQGAAEIVALYQRLRLPDAANLRPWALARMHAQVPSPAMAWLGGTLTSRGPVCDDVHLHGLPAAYAAQLQAPLEVGPPRCCASRRPSRHSLFESGVCLAPMWLDDLAILVRGTSSSSYSGSPCVRDVPHAHVAGL